jgi:hypothetical protein
MEPLNTSWNWFRRAWDGAVADEERHTLSPSMGRISALNGSITEVKASMLHLPNSAGDKDRLQ